MRLTLRELQIVVRAVDDFGWTLTDSEWDTDNPEELRHLEVLETIQRSADTKLKRVCFSASRR